MRLEISHSIYGSLLLSSLSGVRYARIFMLKLLLVTLMPAS